MMTLREFIDKCETHDAVLAISDDCRHAVSYTRDQGIKVRHNNK
jgi:hypothetical protein